MADPRMLARDFLLSVGPLCHPWAITCVVGMRPRLAGFSSPDRLHLPYVKRLQSYIAILGKGTEAQILFSWVVHACDGCDAVVDEHLHDRLVEKDVQIEGLPVFSQSGWDLGPGGVQYSVRVPKGNGVLPILAAADSQTEGSRVWQMTDRVPRVSSGSVAML